MKLCETCKSKTCNKNIIIKIQKQNNLKIIKCLGYEKDTDKTKGYKEPLKRTAK